MGLMDNIRGFFSGSKNKQAQAQVNEDYEKVRLANSIVNLVGKIKGINSLDRSIWNLSNISSYDLQRKSLDELQSINSNLEKRLSELTKQGQASDLKREALEEAYWTGQKPKDMSDHEFDRSQRE